MPLWSLIAGCAVAPLALNDEALLSRADERMLWRQAELEQQSLFRQGKLLADPALTGYVNRVAARLRPPDCPAQLKFEVYIENDPFLNAYAYPNGFILMTTGMLAHLDDEAQLAAVLAHEMAHGINREALRAFRLCAGTEAGGWQAVHGSPSADRPAKM